MLNLSKKEFVRAQLQCASCGKPRMVYSNQALRGADWAVAAEYICGAPLFPPALPLAAFQLVVDETLECTSPVELTYYYYTPTTKNRRADDLLCSVCAAQPGARPEALVADYMRVAPICSSCAAQGHTAAARMRRSATAGAAKRAAQGQTAALRTKQRADALAAVAAARASASQRQHRRSDGSDQSLY